MRQEKRSNPPDYEVGRRRPSTATRFNPGHSGNPRGRPKGSKNLDTLFAEEIRGSHHSCRKWTAQKSKKEALVNGPSPERLATMRRREHLSSNSCAASKDWKVPARLWPVVAQVPGDERGDLTMQRRID